MLCAGSPPGTGIHRYRLFGFAVVDAALTLLASIIISWITRTSILIVLPSMLILGICVHRLLNVNTALNVKLFGSNQ